VNWQVDGDDAVVTHLLPRNNLIIRPSSHGEAKPVAANVDQLLLVISPQPAPTTLLIDRYLTHARFLQVPLQILVNKSDLDLSPLQEIIPIYQALDYPIHQVSTKTEAGLQTLESILAHKTSIMLGQSGVGKSSLMQALLPGQDIRIGALSDRQVGQHTTTTSMLYHVGSGHLIDTPGIYDFATWHLGNQAIAQGFMEIYTLSKHCQFRNCSHSHEPSCAVKTALEQGGLSPSRYQNFLTMCQEKA
jgi:ribosome biogenesis GTPase